MQIIRVLGQYSDTVASIQDYVSGRREEMTMQLFEPDAEKRAVIEFEQNLQTCGLHEKCERCIHSCIQYSAPNLYFYCADFTARILMGGRNE